MSMETCNLEVISEIKRAVTLPTDFITHICNVYQAIGQHQNVAIIIPPTRHRISLAGHNPNPKVSLCLFDHSDVIASGPNVQRTLKNKRPSPLPLMIPT